VNGSRLRGIAFDLFLSPGDFGGALAQGAAPNEIAIGIASWGK
jgi:hypothetical protein